VDADVLPPGILETVDLKSPATTVALLKLNAVVGVKAEVDANYVKLMKMLLKSGVYHGIATHDEKMITATKDFARAEGISSKAFEFQMLHGIRRDLQQELVRDGWRMRVYIPFGSEWYPYFMRRLAERPANVWFVVRNMFKP